ncbi:MAG: M24 family metallopeptidase, partial [Bacteroidota bacterium]
MVHLKSSREIDKLRRSADLVGRTLAEVGRNVSAGVKTAELDRIAESFIKAHGATSAFKGYQFSRKYVPFPGVLCISVNDVVVHGFPSGYELQEGDLISVDCGVVLDGYYGDSAFTFAVGELAPETAALCRVTYESLMSGVERARVGGRLGDIGEAVQTHCESHG